MEIRIIKCPRLNEDPNGRDKEVAVRFYDNQEPQSIMCENYDSEKGCRTWHRKEEYDECIFSRWKPLKRKSEE